MLKNITLSLALVTVLSGCATMFANDAQNIEVRTSNDKAADCTLRNDKGAVNVRAPGTAVVPRSTARLHVDCKGSGYKGRTSNKAGPNPITFVNLISPLWLGFLVDYSNGAMGEYSELLYVPMER